MGRFTRSWLRPAAAPCLAAVLASGGCGARWNEDQQAALAARYESAAESAGAPGAGSRDAAATSGATGTTLSAGTSGASGAATAAGSGADAASGSGPQAALSALPCSAPSNAPGVTPEVITVGNIATITGPVPGLAATSQAAARAYVAYRNATGGVCGRTIELLIADDAQDGGRYRSVLTELEPHVFGLAGAFATADSGGAEVIEATGIPIVGTASSTITQDLPTFFDINPPPNLPAAPIGKFRFLYDQGVRTAAVVTLNNAGAIEELDQQQALIEAGGIQIVSRQILPVTTLSFDSAARVVANSRADYLFFLAADTHDAAMAQAMRDSGYTPRFEEYLTGYGSNYLDIAGAAAEGTSSWIRTLPGEDGGSNPEQAAYLEWMAQTAPGVPADVFAADAWSASKAFFDVLEQLPGPISREALVTQLGTLTSYDAGGLLGPIDLAHDRSNGCYLGMIVESGTWRRLAPADGFLC